MKRITVTFALTLLGVENTLAAGETGPDVVASESDLVQVVAQLDDPKTEMAALERLIKFAGMFLYEGSALYMTGDGKVDELRRAAAKAVRLRRSIDTVRQALDHKERGVRFWGVMGFEVARGKREAWAPLLPRLKEIAIQDPDANIRSEALRRLQSHDSARAFLSELRNTTSELDPWVLMRLFCFDSRIPELRARYYARAVELLSHKDEAVRSRWLSYVYFNAWNPSTAVMWRLEADPTLVEKLREIRETGTPKERTLAGKGLGALLKERDGTAQQPAAANGEDAAALLDAKPGRR